MKTEAEIEGMVRDYTPLAVQIAKGFKRRLPAHVRLDDLRAAAMSGLWDAVRLKPDADYFERYARIRIRGAIQDDLRGRDWLPRFHRDRFPDGVSAVVPMSDAMEATLRSEDDAEGELVALKTAEKIMEALALLPDRHKLVFMERVTTRRTIRSLAAELGVTQARISQIYGEVLQAVRKALAGRE